MRLRNLFLVAVASLTVASSAFAIAPGDIVFSKVYGGGGNSGATFRNDFVELFNRTGSAISLNGFSLQYASATGAFPSTGTNFLAFSSTATIASNGYFLVQLAQGTGGTTNLPTPDATGALALSGTSGKVALSQSTAAVTGSTDTNLVDFVGYGTANAFEGTSAAPTTSNTTGVQRTVTGGNFQDTNNNGADFTTFAADGSVPINNSASAGLNPFVAVVTIPESNTSVLLGVGALLGLAVTGLRARRTA